MAAATPLRFGQLKDAEQIADYHHRCWLSAFAPLVDDQVMQHITPRFERWKTWLAPDSGFTTVVAVGDGDQPIAHTTVQGAELVHLFVDPDHHGGGLGRTLLDVAERLIRQSGHREAHLNTIVGNAPAIALYESHGWIVTDETVDEKLPNGASYTEHVLRKDLTTVEDVAPNQTIWETDASQA